MKIYRYAGLGMAAAIMVFSICGSVFLSGSMGAYAAEEEPEESPEELEESPGVELSLNYSQRKVIYGTCQYLSDIEAFDASGVVIDPAEAVWTSSDEDVATVKYGTVFINGAGKTIITVMYDDNTALMELEVVKPEVSIDKDKLKNRLVGDKCTNWYSSTEDVDVTARSGNKKVAKITKDGSIKVLALGKSKITVKAKNGNTETYTMNVRKRHIYVNDDETFVLSKYIKHVKNYENASWTFSDPSYVQALPDRAFKPLKCGKTTVNTSLNGKKYKVKIRITSYNMMKEVAMEALKDKLRYPASLSVNNIMHNGRSVTIDYSSMNKYGGYDREKFILKINMDGKYTSETVSIYN